MYLASSAHIKQLDNLASEKYGTSLSQLMENAGKSIFDEIKDNFSDNKFAVFCGKGNNGGDGFVVARLLKADGRDVKIYLTHEETELSDTAKVAFDKLKEEKIEILKITEDVDKDAVIIDALLGISLSGAPRGNIKTAIDKITSMNNTVISIDIPSGLSADNGKALGSVVKADYTYTLALDKIGLNTYQGKALCGQKKVLDIGIPKDALSELKFNNFLTDANMYKYLLWDIDGTVLDFLASEAYAIRTLFKKYKLGNCSDEMLKLYSEINSKYWQKLERNELTKSEILIKRFKDFFEIIGADITIAEKFNEEYQITLGDHIEFVDNAEDILLSQKGKFTLVAVTNGTRVAQEKKLHLSGLNEVFDEVFISENVGAEKPNKEYFDYVFEKLGITDKKEVLLIGDSLTSDMKGGFVAGIDTCWFNPKHIPNKLNIPVTYEIDELGKIEEIVYTKHIKES